MVKQIMNRLAPIHTLQQLRNGRIHEVCGSARHSLAAAVCGMAAGAIMWIDESGQTEQVLPSGFLPYFNPSRSIFVHAPTTLDLLWMAEECLRSKTTPTVIAHLSQPLNFTQGRRLQLAAEAGKSLGLFLVPKGMGSNVAETRWRCTPYFDESDSTLQHWQLIKNKSGTISNWITRWDEQAHRIIVVSKAGERSLATRAAD